MPAARQAADLALAALGVTGPVGSSSLLDGAWLNLVRLTVGRGDEAAVQPDTGQGRSGGGHPLARRSHARRYPSIISIVTQQLLDEFAAEFWRSAGVLTFTELGLRQLLERLPDGTPPENPDPRIFVGPDDPNTLGARVHASWRRSDLVSAVDIAGWLREWLTHAWVALVYARWESYYRPAFARLNGVGVDRVGSHVVGDIRHLRNDIVHHGGVATNRNTGRCRIITRFQAGDRIIFTPDDIRVLHAALEVSIDVPPHD